MRKMLFQNFIPYHISMELLPLSIAIFFDFFICCCIWLAFMPILAFKFSQTIILLLISVCVAHLSNLPLCFLQQKRWPKPSLFFSHMGSVKMFELSGPTLNLIIIIKTPLEYRSFSSVCNHSHDLSPYRCSFRISISLNSFSILKSISLNSAICRSLI